MDRHAERHSLKGRGTSRNPDNRFYTQTTEAVDDGWWQEPVPARIPTVMIDEHPRSIVTTNRSPDIPFDQSINPYRGCEHGCIYCYARPSHAYWDMSPGVDFETRIIVKQGAAELLRKQLEKPGYVCSPISIGANTDPYQPIEADRGVTREVLEVLRETRHPFSIITKSALIVRDLDILSEMARDNLCSAAVSITTLDAGLKRILEPRAATPGARLRAVTRLREAGVPVTVMAAPMIPAINDHELESIIEAAAAAGARNVNYIFLRLPLEISALFEDWLNEHFPDRAAHVMSLVRQSRAGKDYDSTFGQRMTGEGVFARLLARRFDVARRRHGLAATEAVQLDTSHFAPGGQLNLF